MIFFIKKALLQVQYALLKIIQNKKWMIHPATKHREHFT